MNFTRLLKKLGGGIGGGIVWPLKRISREIGEELAEKTVVVTKAVEQEWPLLGSMMDRKPFTIITETKVRFVIDEDDKTEGEQG